MSIHDLQVLLALSFGSIVDAGSVVKFCSLFCSELRRESTVDWPGERWLHGTALSGKKSRAGKHKWDLYNEVHKGRARFPSCLRDCQCTDWGCDRSPQTKKGSDAAEPFFVCGDGRMGVYVY